MSNYVQGQPCGRLVYYKKLEQSWSFLQYQKDHVHCEAPSGTVISYIEVLDNWRDGTNGSVSLIAGGVGHAEVRIQLTSRLGKGQSYMVKVMASPITPALRNMRLLKEAVTAGEFGFDVGCEIFG